MRPPVMSMDELMTPGHLACQGCGATQAMRFALTAGITGKESQAKPEVMKST